MSEEICEAAEEVLGFGMGEDAEVCGGVLQEGEGCVEGLQVRH